MKTLYNILSMEFNCSLRLPSMTGGLWPYPVAFGHIRWPSATSCFLPPPHFFTLKKSSPPPKNTPPILFGFLEIFEFFVFDPPLKKNYCTTPNIFFIASPHPPSPQAWSFMYVCMKIVVLKYYNHNGLTTKSFFSYYFSKHEIWNIKYKYKRNRCITF